MSKSKDKKRSSKAGQLINGARNSVVAKKEAQELHNKLEIIDRVDNLIKESTQYDIVEVFDELFDFEAVPNDELTESELQDGFETASGAHPYKMVLQPTKGVDPKVNKIMMEYICPHATLRDNKGSKRKRAVSTFYKVGSGDKVFRNKKLVDSVPQGYAICRCRFCTQIGTLPDDSSTGNDLTAMSDTLATAVTSIEALKSQYAIVIHNMSEEIDDVEKENVIVNQEVMRKLTLVSKSLRDIAKFIEEGTPFLSEDDEKNGKKNSLEIGYSNLLENRGKSNKKNDD